MKQITTNKGVYAIKELLHANGYEYRIEGKWLVYNHDNGFDYLSLPKGEWHFLCTTETITEEIAKGIVGDYIQPLVEFANLLDNNNLSPFKTYAICKQN